MNNKLDEEILHISYLLRISPPVVFFRPLTENTAAQYVFDTREVQVNSWYYTGTYVTNGLIKLLVHELRHCYQHEKWPINKIRRINENYRKYDEALTSNNKEDLFYHYYMSENEVDARMFESNYMLYRRGLISHEIIMLT